MSPSTLLQSLFGSLLDSPAVVEIASQAGKNALSLIQKHFTYSAYEISKAYQDSYGYALGAIRVGVAAPDKTFAFTDKIFQSKITREFAAKIEKHYFQPFAEKRNGEALSSFRKQLIDNIKVLSKRTEKFQFEKVTEEDLVALINPQKTIAITDLVIEQIAPLDDLVADFFRYEGLLGNALLFFFRECLRRDERLKTTQALLQREGLCVTVQDIQNELKAVKAQISKALDDDSPITEFALRRDQLKKAEITWQTRHAELIQFNQRFENQLGELLSWAENIYFALEEIQDDVKETKAEVKETKSLVEEILDKVTALLARQNVSAQIKPRDEFTHHNSRGLELIQEVFSQLKQVSSKTPQYYRASILVGSALSSSGDLERASRLFQQTIENSHNSAERALAHFNLFQVQLRNKAFGDALKNLETAIEIDSQQYSLHDTHKYPMKRILGAGGMGCVFLCGYRLKRNKRVAVKCFWENRKGSRDEIFHEPLLMAEIAGEWVPEPLDYGYFDNAQQARAFFVTEYIDDAIDGEAWLEKNGHLNVKTALPVALQIAQGLQIAHQEGIFHLDLKPANLLLIQTKKDIAVKIIDFGLSQVANSLRDEVAGQKTRTGLTTFGQAIFGTLDYAPPEQQGYIQFGQPSAKSDIFAFGKTLYRLLTGEMPLEVEPETLEDSPNWYKLLYSCTRTNPAKRPQSVEELISLLKAIETVSETKTTETSETQLGKRFQFEIVTVNHKGEIIHREQKQACCQTEDLGNDVTLEMVYIPGGTFTMGSPENEERRYGDESPQHQVTVQPFFMAKYPVTQAQWQAVMDNNPSRFKGEKRPVEKVSWDDAVKFCQRLSEKTGKAYRLPSEAEWEYACRAGTTTPFYFGETITTDLANYNGKYTYASEPKGVYRAKTTDVGNFPPNAFGLYDMHGNVWEWCADHWHENYEGAPSEGSIWEEGNSGRPVVRGGSWYNLPGSVRAATRDRDSRDYRNYLVGFRLAR
ncbi:MAG: tetratricopeptide repeat protein [Thiomargarita sp.]|nr:tetratricopeptide repeat protein [Thiomargarita sp.]